MVFFVRITVNQSHLRPICKSTKFNPKIQRTIYLINFQQLRLHVPEFIRTVVQKHIICPNTHRSHHAKDYQICFQMQQPKQNWLAATIGYGWQSEDSLSCLLQRCYPRKMKPTKKTMCKRNNMQCRSTSLQW